MAERKKNCIRVKSNTLDQKVWSKVLQDANEKWNLDICNLKLYFAVCLLIYMKY